MSSVGGQPLATPPTDAAAGGDRWVNELGQLLAELQDVADGSSARTALGDLDNQLIEVRLGVAAGLFAALQCKDAAAAGHSLRVALSVSAWAQRMGLSPTARDQVEVAALLHDIGVIGVPDRVLFKPSSLDADETNLIAAARRMSLAILRRSCASPEVLAIVEHVPAWFNGAERAFVRAGEELPLGSRMIAIVEAFDAMTTDRVYRPAMSLEAAATELFQCAGTQFDARLVADFADYLLADRQQLSRDVARRWLHGLDPALVNSYWQLNCVPSPPPAAGVESFFQARLLENMYDAVVFVDAAMRILFWNHGAERLTGVMATSLHSRQWQAEALRMCDEQGRPIGEADCPVRTAIQAGVQSLRRLSIAGRSGRVTAVDTHAIPVPAEDGRILGAVLLLHDASSETSLEQRCQNLYEKSTKDPLTQVANRAEFDRVHAMFVAAHQQQRAPCSMMICDIDRFKQINDVYGHQAGDEGIKALASLLKAGCRPGDLVARYGGEEFVMLFADCDNATAARRSEQLRKTLCQLPLPVLDGRSISASFGVTEAQPGDTPETMLRRADRALLMAKSQGRNRVVQLGSGGGQDAEGSPAGREGGRGDTVVEQTLLTPVPIKMAVEKLRGFVADHEAEIVSVEANVVELRMRSGPTSWMRRLSDRPVTFVVQLRFEEEQYQKADSDAARDALTRTKIHVVVQKPKNRDRRRDEIAQRGREILTSLRSYLMAVDAEPADGVMRRVVKRMLVPWLTKR